jgi:hypothetical protein
MKPEEPQFSRFREKRGTLFPEPIVFLGTGLSGNNRAESGESGTFF